MGDSPTLELILKEFTELISNWLNEISSAVGNIQGTTNAGNLWLQVKDKTIIRGQL